VSIPFLFTGPDDAPVTLLLAHGSGAPMDSAAMNAATAALSAEGLRVARFEFSYMAARPTDGSRRPPPKAETLNPEGPPRHRRQVDGRSRRQHGGGRAS
jgi:predicted alpha/beta-hydrolase family hydrolase